MDRYYRLLPSADQHKTAQGTSLAVLLPPPTTDLVTHTRNENSQDMASILVRAELLNNGSDARATCSCADGRW
jgi:hypothetical protein